MERSSMDRRATGIIAYLTIVGWFVAYTAGDKEGAKFHLNQALVVHLASIVLVMAGYLPIIGWFVWIFRLLVLACGILGAVYAFQDQDKEVPLLGIIKLLK